MRRVYDRCKVCNKELWPGSVVEINYETYCVDHVPKLYFGYTLGELRMLIMSIGLLCFLVPLYIWMLLTIPHADMADAGLFNGMSLLLCGIFLWSVFGITLPAMLWKKDIKIRS